MKKLFAALLFLSLAVPAFAADDPRQFPLLSLARLDIGARAEYLWQGSNVGLGDASLRRRSVGAGIAMAYALVPRLSLTARSIFYVDAPPQWALGVNLHLFSGHDWAVNHPESVSH